MSDVLKGFSCSEKIEAFLECDKRWKQGGGDGLDVWQFLQHDDLVPFDKDDKNEHFLPRFCCGDKEEGHMFNFHMRGQRPECARAWKKNCYYFDTCWNENEDGVWDIQIFCPNKCVHSRKKQRQKGLMFKFRIRNPFDLKKLQQDLEKVKDAARGKRRNVVGRTYLCWRRDGDLTAAMSLMDEKIQNIENKNHEDHIFYPLVNVMMEQRELFKKNYLSSKSESKDEEYIDYYEFDKIVKKVIGRLRRDGVKSNNSKNGKNKERNEEEKRKKDNNKRKLEMTAQSSHKNKNNNNENESDDCADEKHNGKTCATASSATTPNRTKTAKRTRMAIDSSADKNRNRDKKEGSTTGDSSRKHSMSRSRLTGKISNNNSQRIVKNKKTNEEEKTDEKMDNEDFSNEKHKRKKENFLNRNRKNIINRNGISKRKRKLEMTGQASHKNKNINSNKTSKSNKKERVLANSEGDDNNTNNNENINDRFSDEKHNRKKENSRNKNNRDNGTTCATASPATQHETTKSKTKTKRKTVKTTGMAIDSSTDRNGNGNRNRNRNSDKKQGSTTGDSSRKHSMSKSRLTGKTSDDNDGVSNSQNTTTVKSKKRNFDFKPNDCDERSIINDKNNDNYESFDAPPSLKRRKITKITNKNSNKNDAIVSNMDENKKLQISKILENEMNKMEINDYDNEKRIKNKKERKIERNDNKNMNIINCENINNIINSSISSIEEDEGTIENRRQKFVGLSQPVILIIGGSHTFDNSVLSKDTFIRDSFQRTKNSGNRDCARNCNNSNYNYKRNNKENVRENCTKTVDSCFGSHNFDQVSTNIDRLDQTIHENNANMMNNTMMNENSEKTKCNNNNDNNSGNDNANNCSSNIGSALNGKKNSGNSFCASNALMQLLQQVKQIEKDVECDDNVKETLSKVKKALGCDNIAVCDNPLH